MQNISDIYLTEQTSNPIGEKFVVFTLGDELFAVSAQKVSEVAQPISITALPNSPEWLFGITNLRGEIVSVINLPKLWNFPIPTSFTRPKIIILREKFGTIAIVTDRLNEIINLPNEAIKPSKENPHIYAQATIEMKTLNLIDSEKLFFALSEQRV